MLILILMVLEASLGLNIAKRRQHCINTSNYNDESVPEATADEPNAHRQLQSNRVRCHFLPVTGLSHEPYWAVPKAYECNSRVLAWPCADWNLPIILTPCKADEAATNTMHPEQRVLWLLSPPPPPRPSLLWPPTAPSRLLTRNTMR